MIDYGCGSVITVFPFGVIAPALFITLDYQSAWDQFVGDGQLVIQNLLHPWGRTEHYFKYPVKVSSVCFDRQSVKTRSRRTNEGGPSRWRNRRQFG